MCIRDRVVLHVLRDLFVAAVQVADFWRGLGDEFSIEIEHDAEHSVRRGMGGAEIQRHRLAEQLAGGNMDILVSQLLDGLLGATQGIWGFVGGTRGHVTELKTMN